MLRIEHLNFTVSNMDETLKFYRAVAPHWQVLRQGQYQYENKTVNWCHFGDDFQYLTFNEAIKTQNPPKHRFVPGVNHFALETHNLSEMVARLEQAGFTPTDNGVSHPHRKNVYFYDPDHVEIEFVEYSSDNPAQRNSDSEE